MTLAPVPTGPAGPGPTGPAGPGPGGPAGPNGPQPSEPERITSLSDDAAVLDLIDAQLIGLLTVAYFGPAEQGTSESVRQACAAQVLLHRLRMSRRAVAELRDALNLPARLPVEARSPKLATASGEPGSISGRDGRVASPGGTWPDGRAVGADGAATFTLPKPPEFQIGTALIGGRQR